MSGLDRGAAGLCWGLVATSVTAPGHRRAPVPGEKRAARRRLLDTSRKAFPGQTGAGPGCHPRERAKRFGSVTPERLRPRRDSRPGPAGTSGQATRSAGSACMSFQEGAHWLSLRCCMSPSVLLLPLPSAHLLCKGGGEKRTNHKGMFLPQKKKINRSPGDAPKCQAS